MSHERRKTWQDRVININIANEAASLINSTKLSDLLSINSITATQFWPICQPWSQHTHHTFTMTATLFKYRIIIKTAKLMYHIFRSQCPPYLIDLISFLPKHHQQFRLQSPLARAAVTQQTRIQFQRRAILCVWSKNLELSATRYSNNRLTLATHSNDHSNHIYFVKILLLPDDCQPKKLRTHDTSNVQAVRVHTVLLLGCAECAA